MPQTNEAHAENSPANLDSRFDRSLEEAFPTSGSVSAKITKGGAIDYDDHGMAASTPAKADSQKTQSPAERPMDEAKDVMSEEADTTSGARGAASGQSEQKTPEAPDRRVEVESRAHAGVRAAPAEAAENAWALVLGGVAIGYALGWMIHTGGTSTSVSNPNHMGSKKNSPRAHRGERAYSDEDMGSA